MSTRIHLFKFQHCQCGISLVENFLNKVWAVFKVVTNETNLEPNTNSVRPFVCNIIIQPLHVFHSSQQFSQILIFIQMPIDWKWFHTHTSMNGMKYCYEISSTGAIRSV